MRQKRLLWTMAAALTLVGCSQDETLMGGAADNGNAITFGTYVGRGAQTRATEVTTGSLQTEGFGVNAWYTKDQPFDGATEKEVFMENTKVTYNEDKGAWTYSPLKYWPNMEGHMVSFFAYGPYSVKDKNQVSGTDITFTVAEDAKEQVDLIYHNQTKNKTIDLKKPAVDATVDFLFDHALARIDFSVEAASDIVTVSPDNNSKLDGSTVINIKKLVLLSGNATEYTEPAAGPFYKSGTLSLTDGSWDEFSTEFQSFTLTGEHFYRTVEVDGKEVVQLHKFNNKQDLLNDESYLMIIPQDLKTDGFKIYIEYDVVTTDEEGIDHSTVNNRILSDEALPVNFEQGKAYNFNLVLGMTSVKFTADVTPWENATGYEGEEWLPENTTNNNGLLLNRLYNKEKNAFEIATTEDLQALSGAVKEGAEYTLDENGNPVAVTASRAATRSGEEGEENVYSYAAADYIQVAPIDLTGIDWEPIGVKEELDEEEYDNTRLFSGTYDAQSKYSITYALDGKDFSGIFRAISNAEIKGLTVNGTITNSKAESTGGIVGESVSEGATISNCHFQGSITTGEGAQFVGGIIGNADYVTTIEGCSNGATLTVGDEGRIGGIAGNVNGSSSIYACYNYGAVTANSTGYAGAAGIVGQLDGNYIELFACYNTGEITATGDGSIAGEIVSYIGSENTVENNCYGGSNYAYEEGNDCEYFNYAVDGNLLAWTVNSSNSASTALNVMNNALAANGCEWKYVAGDETIKLKVVNEPASEVEIPALTIAKENAKKGDLAMKDGTFLSVYGYTTLTDEQKSNCGGVVFWTQGEEGKGQSSLSEDKMLSALTNAPQYGLIVSLKDLIYTNDEGNPSEKMKRQLTEGGVSNWQETTNYEKDHLVKSYINNGDDDPKTLPINTIVGYQNTQIMKAYNEAMAEYEEDKSKVIIPIVALEQFAESNGTITGCTEWFVPSLKELDILCNYDRYNMNDWFDSEKKSHTAKIVNASIAKLLDDSNGITTLDGKIYWSTTETGYYSNGMFSFGFDFESSGYRDRCDNDGDEYYVRAVCAY